jgi:hypothetical protein
MEQIDNPPVFPDPMRAGEANSLNQNPHELPTGMSLRDYFAAKAMQGMLSAFNRGLPDFECLYNLTKTSYNVADAMLAARKETKTE